jgi:hypothetical protein
VAFWGGVVENNRVGVRTGDGVDTGRRSAGASKLRRNVVAMVVVAAGATARLGSSSSRCSDGDATFWITRDGT